MKHTHPLYGDGVGGVTLLHYSGNDLSAVNSARVSFNRESEVLDEKDKKLLRYLAKNQHTSPFEHCAVTFKISVPLFVARQWMRHRTLSFNEISRRYTSENIAFYSPAFFYYQSEDNRQGRDEVHKGSDHFKLLFDNCVDESFLVYEHLIEAGISREQARMVLPASLYTHFIVSGNLLNWIKFIKLRSDEHAQEEIRHASDTILNILRTLYPETLKAWF